MASDYRRQTRYALLALGITAVLAGCGGSSTNETAGTPSADSGSTVVQDNTAAPLEGLALEVHRDPG